MDLHTESDLGRHIGRELQLGRDDLEKVDRDDLEENYLDAKGDAKVDTGKVKRTVMCENDGNIEIEELKFEPHFDHQRTLESDTDGCNYNSKYCINSVHDLKMNDLKASNDDVDNNSMPNENKSVSLNAFDRNASSEIDKDCNHAKADNSPGPMNNTLQSANSDFADSMQFSSVVENIFFLDGEELMQEHEKDKQKNALLTNLVSDKHAISILDENSNMDHNLVFNKGAIQFPDETIEKMIRESDSQTESPFSYLPDELIVKIFSYLNTEQLSRHALPVCRKWRQIAKEPTLWRTIDFHCRPQLESLTLLWVLRKTPGLRKLVLRGRTNITHAEVAILSEMCPLLNNIDFGFCDDLNCDMIHTLVENCKELRKLNIEGCDKIDHNCVKCLSKCKKLSCLNFSHCLLQDESLIHLAENLSQIVSLNLDGISWITDRLVMSARKAV